MTTQEFSAVVGALLQAARLQDFQVSENEYESGPFGNASAIFRGGNLLMRTIRDRGQEFVELSSTVEGRDLFFDWDDVEIAMGWKSIDDVLGKKAPEVLFDVFQRISSCIDKLQEAFSPEAWPKTKALLVAAKAQRGARFVQSLHIAAPRRS